jgi:HK97 family phage portal protein
MLCTYTNSKKGYLQLSGYGSHTPFLPFGSGDLNEILHIRKKNIFSNFYGVPEWLPALESLRLDQNIKLFNSSFFKNSAKPDYAVILEGADFSPEAEKKIKDALKQTKGVENAHRTLILGVPFEDAKLRIEKIEQNMKDWDFEKITKASREEIIAAHGVPPRLLGIVTAGQPGGGGEMEGQLKTFYKTIIQPEGNYIAEKLNKILRAGGKQGTVKFVLPKELDPETTVTKGQTPGTNFEDIFWRM